MPSFSYEKAVCKLADSFLSVPISSYRLPITFSISPISVMLLTRFFMIDMFKFLLTVDLYWDKVCESLAALWQQKKCLRDCLS